MEKEFKDFEMETPSLTLEPDLGAVEEKEEIAEVKQPEKEPEAPALTPAEQKMVRNLLQKLILRIQTRSFSMEREPRRRWQIFPIQHWRM